jgi:hypothetical protein
MNRIDQKLVIVDAHTLDAAFFAKNILDLGVAGRDNDRGVEAVLSLDLTGDDGTFDAATITCSVFSDDTANPSIAVQTVFVGTVAAFRTMAAKQKGAVRVGLISKLDRYVSCDLYASVALPMLATFRLEAVE